MICIGTKFLDSEDKMIEKLGLKNKVLYFDNVNKENLGYLYQRAFALVYPSLYEGFGLPPLEAMSCGCPVIASNTSSIPEVVADAGILINPYDVNAIATALEKLLSDDIRNYYITKGLDRAELFSWEQTAQKYTEIYKSLMTDSK
jgi:mannosyltransferase